MNRRDFTKAVGATLFTLAASRRIVRPQQVVRRPIAASGGGGDFDYTNMFVRLRAADITGKSNGDAVTSNWLDTSGNGYDFSPTNSPTYRSADGPNSKPCVRFVAASSQYFTGPNWSGLGLTAVDVFIVIKKNADPAATAASSGIWTLGGAASDIFRICIVPFNDGVCYDTAFSLGTRTTNNFATTLAQWNLYQVHNQHAVGGAFNNFLNGTAGSTPQTNGVVNPATVYLGRSSVVGFDWFCDGDIAEFFCFSVSTSGAQLASIKSYISSFYGLTIV